MTKEPLTLRYYLPPSPGYNPCARAHVFLVTDDGKPQPGASCLCGQRTYGQVQLERTIGKWRLDMVRNERWCKIILCEIAIIVAAWLVVRFW